MNHIENKLIAIDSKAGGQFFNQNQESGLYSTPHRCNNSAYIDVLETKYCTMGSTNDDNDIDDIDRQLLALVQRDALISTENMALEVGLSATSAKRRLNKLRRNGTIIKDVSIIEPKRLGFEVFTLVSVNLERDRRDIIHSFKLDIKKNPRIIQGFYTTGDSDFLLLVASKSLEEYDSFTQDFFWENHNIKSFKTMVVMDYVKLGFELPMN